MITTPLIEGEIQFSLFAGGSVLASKGGSYVESSIMFSREGGSAQHGRSVVNCAP